MHRVTLPPDHDQGAGPAIGGRRGLPACGRNPPASPLSTSRPVAIVNYGPVRSKRYNESVKAVFLL